MLTNCSYSSSDSSESSTHPDPYSEYDTLFLSNGLVLFSNVVFKLRYVVVMFVPLLPLLLIQKHLFMVDTITIMIEKQKIVVCLNK